MKPKRIQRKRTKGWRMPKDAVYVGRPTKWGNPCIPLATGRTRQDAVEVFRHCLNDPTYKIGKDDVIRELRGKDLACWCPIGMPCHADVLLEIANS